MEIPNYEPFYLRTSEELRAEIARLGLSIPLAENFAPLAQPLIIGSRRASNRFCAQPITGCDASPGGAPGELTRRRYTRLAEGGFGLIWFESTLAGNAAPSVPGVLHHKRLVLSEATLNAFTTMLKSVRASGRAAPLAILQLASSTGAELDAMDDDAIERLRDELVHAAALAARAGFDGVDIQSCHRAFAGRLLRAFTRAGRFGGAFENRSRFLLETFAAIRAQSPSLTLGVRLSAYDAARGGFGVSSSDYRQPDLAEPVRLAQLLQSAGVSLLNVTAASPNLRASASERGSLPLSDSTKPYEHPLTVLGRQLRIARTLREAAPDVAVIGSGFGWLRQFVPHVAAAAIAGDAIDFAGMGRGALAYPDAPRDVLTRGEMELGQSCMVCFACSTLCASGEPVGCTIRDASVYGTPYRHMRRFDPDSLLAGARRCHQCEAAPCVVASPTLTDIPMFIGAFLRGDERAAGEIIRARDPLPELTSQLSPAWLQAEGACIETALTGTPVPILDLQYAIAWRARECGETGVRVPAAASGGRIAVVGGGPAGIAAAVRLIECGHTVALFEASERLGGVPSRVIPAGRLPDIHAEIDAVIQPALTARRLALHFNTTFGSAELSLPRLTAEFDAVLLAAGVWQERSLARMPGVVGALDFLESAKRGTAEPMPERVAILAGGDSAMDAARVVERFGAREIFVVFGGPRSAMHWHMPESWFAKPGVHAMMECATLGFVAGEDGRACGIRIRHAQLNVESVLHAGLFIEAMGLSVADSMRAALDGVDFSEAGLVRVDAAHRTSAARVYAAGGLVNGGASVGQCVAEGLAAADAIHADLEPRTSR